MSALQKAKKKEAKTKDGYGFLLEKKKLCQVVGSIRTFYMSEPHIYEAVVAMTDVKQSYTRHCDMPPIAARLNFTN
jgi:hypothetical protein